MTKPTPEQVDEFVRLGTQITNRNTGRPYTRHELILEAILIFQRGFKSLTHADLELALSRMREVT